MLRRELGSERRLLAQSEERVVHLHFRQPLALSAALRTVCVCACVCARACVRVCARVYMTHTRH